MGHQRIAGRVTEAEIGGCKFVRVDVPEIAGRQALTKFLGPSSIYAITSLTEETALALAVRIDCAPVTAWDAKTLVQREGQFAQLSLPGEKEDEDGEDY
jgi:hypothetical protein